MPDDTSDEEETSTESNSDIPLHHYEEDNIPDVAEEYEINTSHDRSEGVKHVKKVECITNPPFLDHVYAAGTSPGSTDVNVQDTAVQTDTTMNDINIMSDQIHQLQAKLDDKTTLLRECFIETVTKNDENVKLYTGLASLAMLLGIFNILAAKCSALKYCQVHPVLRRKITRGTDMENLVHQENYLFIRNLFFHLFAHVYYYLSFVLLICLVYLKVGFPRFLLLG